ncbi:MAG: citramalate synthase [Mariprofundus sp.]
MTTNVRRIQLYDTTLRDGAQSAGIHFSAEDKKRIAHRLASFGMDWIEGGWPGASPTDDRFFELMRKRSWSHSRLVAFGSTARPGHPASADAGLAKLVGCGADAVCIFGKSWDLHVTTGLGIELETNLALVRDSVAWLKQHVETVMFDAEHFFDGYVANRDYAMQVLAAAAAAGADALVLCDTNGGSLPDHIAACVRDVVATYPDVAVGIHAHNDSEMAVGNTIAAVCAGASHVQGTVNGIGERCGNGNLISIIPALKVKMGLDCGIVVDSLKKLRGLSTFVNEMANQLPWQHQPYVGQNAFAHKGGIHVSAVRKASCLYEHIDPASVGNLQRILVSNQAGRSNILVKLQQLEPGAEVDDASVIRVVQRIKEMEAKGYAFEGADASFQLLLRRATGHFRRHFELVSFRVYDEKRGHDQTPESEATVQVKVNGVLQHKAALGNGPVNAMDRALRAALAGVYPGLEDMRLTDFKVRVLSTRDATQAVVRVLIESSDGVRKWNTVGVSSDVLEATYRALNDAIEYKLVVDMVKSEGES